MEAPEIPPGFSWVVDGQLAGMKFPAEEAHYKMLPALNIGTIICLHEVAPSFDMDHLWDSAPFRPQFKHFPIDDYGIPKNMDIVNEICQIWDKESERALVVHCMAGLSRTGMILACILVQKFHMSAQEAIQLVNKKRSRNGGAVMTTKQERFVDDYEKYSKEHK